MPAEIIEADDPISRLVQFRTSPVFEMLVSLHTLLANRRHEELSSAVKAQLPADFWAELAEVYAPFNNGALFPEMAVGYEYHEDVDGFIQYMRRLDPVSFVFYFIGRIVPPEQIAATGMDPDKLMMLIKKHPFYESHLSTFPLRDALANVTTFKARLVAVWERYWKEYFSAQVEALRPRWAQAIEDKRAVLAREGGRALLEIVTGKADAIYTMPDDFPVTELVFVPIYYIPHRRFVFYGYGNETILFDSERTAAQIAESTQRRQQTLDVLKALADPSRVDLLGAIAHAEGGPNGKQLAALMHSSPSTVSRQLGQLREAGLITEVQRDDGSITYTLQRERIDALSGNIIEMLYGSK